MPSITRSRIGLGGTLGLATGDAPARQMAVDVHPRETVNQRAAGDLDLLEVDHPQRAAGKASASSGIRVADDRDVAAPAARDARGMPPDIGRADSIVRQQMKSSAKLMVNGDHGAIDVADKAVAKNDVGNFPVPA